MSGVEVVGLISGIISIVDAIVKVHNAIKDTSGLPSAFRDIAPRLPLLKESLIAAQEGIEDGADGTSYSSLKTVLEGCARKAVALERMFRAMALKPSTSKFRRYLVLVRSLGKGRQVEDLMDSILDDMQLLIGNYAIRSASRAHVQDILTEIRKATIYPTKDSYESIYRSGTGFQSIHSGEGDQYINTGSGSQLSGNFAAPLNFYRHEQS